MMLSFAITAKSALYRAVLRRLASMVRSRGRLTILFPSALVMPMLGAGSCVFLMYYLAADTWWRFIGWLVLGLSIYLAYGYTRSAIGIKLGRPSRTPPVLKLAALGFFAMAVGLFTVPHDIGFGGVFDAAFSASAPQHGARSQACC